MLEDCQALRAALHFHIPQLDAEVIKRLVVPDQQYYLEFFDQATGLLVKSENWVLQGEQWVMIEDTFLVAFQPGS